MTESQNSNPANYLASPEHGKTGFLFIRLFRWSIRLTLVVAVLTAAYWMLGASDRYVSEASVIIRKTDSVSAPALDISMLVSNVGGVNRADQLLLREYLLSVDMLKKLDSELGIRAHYSDSSRDIVSRMWFPDASMEWFHRHYLSRIAIDYDDFAGVLRLKVQAYDPTTAQAISNMLVREGERYMNQIGHEMAEVQVNFLTSQVTQAQLRVQQASKILLAFQNQKGVLSPAATAESFNVLIAKLEEQRAQVQTQLASLPKNLDRDQPNVVMLKQSLAAIDRQINTEKAKLANPAGRTLNITLEEFQRLQMEVGFTQELYKGAMAALEKGRIEATRLLEKVSVLQAPTLPEYPMEPRRIYNTVVTLLCAGLLAGILKLLESIVLDHVD